MAAALENPQQAAPEEDSKSSSMAPLDDIEKTRLPGAEDTAGGTPSDYQRPVNGFKWFLVCVGLYLGAVLYGEHFRTIFLECKQYS